MSYDHFCRSAKGPAEVRAFLYHILSLRGGWNGSGYERQFIGGQPVCSLLVPNIDLTSMAAEDFAQVNLGAPSQEEIIERMCEGLAKLREAL